MLHRFDGLSCWSVNWKMKSYRLISFNDQNRLPPTLDSWPILFISLNLIYLIAIQFCDNFKWSKTIYKPKKSDTEKKWCQLPIKTWKPCDGLISIHCVRLSVILPVWNIVSKIRWTSNTHSITLLFEFRKLTSRMSSSGSY